MKTSQNTHKQNGNRCAFSVSILCNLICQRQVVRITWAVLLILYGFLDKETCPITDASGLSAIRTTVNMNGSFVI